MRQYEAAISEGGYITVICYDSDGPQLEAYPVTDPLVLKKAVEFALKERTNHRGTRVLSAGQANVLNSLVDARSAEGEAHEQDAWETAAKKTLQEAEPLAEVVFLRPVPLADNS